MVYNSILLATIQPILDKYAKGQLLIIELYSRRHIWKLCTVECFFPGTMATRSEDYYKEDDEDSYNYKKTILKMGKMKTVEKTRKMKVVKKKVIVKMRKIDNCMYNYDVDYNDDECEDIGKVRQMKIGQEDEENED